MSAAERLQASLNLADTSTREILWGVVNVMRRCDPLYCNAHAQEPCTDEEWDTALQAAEDELDRLGLAPHAAGVTP